MRSSGVTEAGRAVSPARATRTRGEKFIGGILSKITTYLFMFKILKFSFKEIEFSLQTI